METTRYFVPDHPSLTEVYSRDELRHFLQRGQLSRSDMICDDETGLAHLLGDLLSLPYRDATLAPSRSTRSSIAELISPNSHEFRADTPLTSAHQNTPPTEPSNHQPSNQTRHAQESIPPSRINPHLDPDPDLNEDQEEYETDNQSPNHDEHDNEDDELQDLRPYNPFGQSDLPQFEEELEDSDYLYPTSSFPASSAPEETLYLGHPSWLAFPKSLLGFTLSTAATIYILAAHIGLEWAMLLVSIAGLFLVYITLHRTTTTYFITTHRVEIEFGIIGRNTKEVRIRDIRAIDVQQRGYKALVGLGTLEFDSSASSGPEVIFKNVRRPHQVKELVRSLQVRR